MTIASNGFLPEMIGVSNGCHGGGTLQWAKSSAPGRALGAVSRDFTCLSGTDRKLFGINTAAGVRMGWRPMARRCRPPTMGTDVLRLARHARQTEVSSHPGNARSRGARASGWSCPKGLRQARGSANSRNSRRGVMPRRAAHQSGKTLRKLRLMSEKIILEIFTDYV